LNACQEGERERTAAADAVDADADAAPADRPKTSEEGRQPAEEA